MLPDYHMHTLESKDAQASVTEMCEKAEEIGLKDICFTNHFDFEEIVKKHRYICMTIEELDSFIKKLDDARNNFSLKIKLGVEIDYRKEYEKDIEKFLDDYGFDFALGAIHFLKKKDITNSELSGQFFSTVRTDEAYKLYFEKTHRLIQSGLFDVVAHIDAIRKFTGVMIEPYGFENYRDLVEKAIQLMLDTDTGIELNTGGYDNPIGDAYPSIEFLKLAREMGLKKITTGSDSHKPEQLARYFDRAEERLKTAGFKNVCVFDKRKPRFVEF